VSLEPKKGLKNILSKSSRKSKKLSLKEKRQKDLERKQQKKNQRGIRSPRTDKLIAHYQNGQYDEAEKLARSIVDKSPNDLWGWKILGIVLGEKNLISEALVANQNAVRIDPKEAGLHCNVGAGLLQLSRWKEAEVSFRQAIELNSGMVEAHLNLGETLRQMGKLDEAEASCQRALALNPDDPEAQNSLGSTLHDLGRVAEAEVAYKKAIELNSSLTIAQNNLSNLLGELGRFDEAEANCRRTLALRPNDAEAYNVLGVTLLELKRLDEAFSSFIRALQINPEYTDAYRNIAPALSEALFKKPNPHIQGIITSILDQKTIAPPYEIANAAISILKLQPHIKNALEMHSAGELKASLNEIILSLSEIPLLLKLMSVCPMRDLELEGLLTNIRSELLSSINEINARPEIISFQTALALHCFTNEYIYEQTDIETVASEKLEATIHGSLLNGEQPKPQLILCLATYKALHQYEWCDRLTLTADIKEVFTQQIVEPDQERVLKSDIPVLQEITDEVSSKVRDQYEENPYPRWINLGLPPKPIPISKNIEKLKLHLYSYDLYKTQKPTILIAGCGTGQHSIHTAATYKNATTLAVDLSLSSLAYAKRKSEELDVKNIEYMQADILDLEQLERQFDIIESGGVLHHMDDPIVGWKVLTNCLNPGGIIRIGLYSQLARQGIMKVREEISRLGIEESNQGMKAFRRHIINSNQDHHKRIPHFGDFYSMSEFRDLLFHVKEHQFTLKQIKCCLEDLGLKFCGFTSARIVNNFKLTNTETDSAYDLEKWNLYEETNPDTFSGMYQFWCQKVT
jgi:tetratricopeptide (TPR) repeat protein/SAM-dependent methyltransferase